MTTLKKIILLNLCFAFFLPNLTFAKSCVNRTIATRNIVIDYKLSNGGKGDYRPYHTRYSATARACGFGKKRRAAIKAAEEASRGMVRLWKGNLIEDGLKDGLPNLCNQHQVTVYKMKSFASTGLSRPLFKDTTINIGGNNNNCEPLR